MSRCREQQPEARGVGDGAQRFGGDEHGLRSAGGMVGVDSWTSGPEAGRREPGSLRLEAGAALVGSPTGRHGGPVG
jgi:hypothetical protein